MLNKNKNKKSFKVTHLVASFLVGIMIASTLAFAATKLSQGIFKITNTPNFEIQSPEPSLEIKPGTDRKSVV